MCTGGAGIFARGLDSDSTGGGRESTRTGAGDGTDGVGVTVGARNSLFTADAVARSWVEGSLAGARLSDAVADALPPPFGEAALPPRYSLCSSTRSAITSLKPSYNSKEGF